MSSQTRHPGVKGNGYVPYYVVFDHKGDMAYHHMCGPYHGGDGLEMIKWVDKLLEAAPDIYLGEETFEHIDDLADKVRARKGLAGTIKKLEALRDGDDGAKKEEARRLLSALGGWRDRQLERAMGLLSSDPAEVVPTLKALSKELAGTELQAPITERLEETAGSDALKRSLALQKAHEKVWKSIRKLKVPQGGQAPRHRGVRSRQSRVPRGTAQGTEEGGGQAAQGARRKRGSRVRRDRTQDHPAAGLT